MANNCDSKIAVNVTYDACNPATKGLKPIGYLANFEDIDHTAMMAESNLVAGYKNLFKDCKLKSGARLVKIYQSGKTPFSGANTEAQEGTYRTTWNKTLPIVILDNGADVTHNIVDKLANGKFVAIVENAFPGRNGDNAFEIVGLETGLALSEGNAEKYNEDFGGGWSLTLQEQNAPKSGLYILVESNVAGVSRVDATRALLDSYLISSVTISGDTSVELTSGTTSKQRTYATSTGEGVTATTEAEWLTVSASGNKVTFTPQAYASSAEGPATRTATVVVGVDGSNSTLEVTVSQPKAN